MRYQFMTRDRFGPAVVMARAGSANFSLCSSPSGRRSWRALRPDGLHSASFRGGGVEGRDRFGRYFNFLDLPQLLAIYHVSAAWEVVTTDQYMGGGYGRSEGSWAAVTVRKLG